MNPSLRSLTSLVLTIFAGTALTVGSYLDSKRPLPEPAIDVQESKCLQSVQDASEHELAPEVICPVSGRAMADCGRERTS